MPADTSGPNTAWWAVLPLTLTALAAGAWLVLALWKPTTTWHLAPALVGGAGAWVVASADTDKTSHQRRRIGALAVLGLVVALVELAALHAYGRLEGPTLLGPNAVVESIVTATVGAASAVMASFRRTARTPTEAREDRPMSR